MPAHTYSHTNTHTISCSLTLCYLRIDLISKLSNTWMVCYYVHILRELTILKQSLLTFFWGSPLRIIRETQAYKVGDWKQKHINFIKSFPPPPEILLTHSQSTLCVDSIHKMLSSPMKWDLKCFLAVSCGGHKYSSCKLKNPTAFLRSSLLAGPLFPSRIEAGSWFTGKGSPYLHLYWCVWRAGRKVTGSILIGKKMDWTGLSSKRWNSSDF